MSTGMSRQPTIEQAVRVLMAHSLYAASVLGKRTPASPIFQQLYNRVASQVLGNANVSLTPEERALVAQFVTLDDEDDNRTFMLRVRLTESERAALEQMANEAGVKMSDYVRRQLFG